MQGIEIRAVTEKDWATVREVRLRALVDCPDNFWATHADEVDRPGSWWRGFVGNNGWFVAFEGEIAVGLAAGMRDPDAPSTHRELISMWVSPAYRGRGIGTELVDKVAEWARAQGAEVLGLMVTTGNDGAQRLYERCGFRLTGETVPHPRKDDLAELGMTRRL